MQQQQSDILRLLPAAIWRDVLTPWMAAADVARLAATCREAAQRTASLATPLRQGWRCLLDDVAPRARVRLLVDSATQYEALGYAALTQREPSTRVTEGGGGEWRTDMRGCFSVRVVAHRDVADGAWHVFFGTALPQQAAAVVDACDSRWGGPRRDAYNRMCLSLAIALDAAPADASTARLCCDQGRWRCADLAGEWHDGAFSRHRCETQTYHVRAVTLGERMRIVAALAELLTHFDTADTLCCGVSRARHAVAYTARIAVPRWLLAGIGDGVRWRCATGDVDDRRWTTNRYVFVPRDHERVVRAVCALHRDAECAAAPGEGDAQRLTSARNRAVGFYNAQFGEMTLTQAGDVQSTLATQLMVAHMQRHLTFADACWRAPGKPGAGCDAGKRRRSKRVSTLMRSTMARCPVCRIVFAQPHAVGAWLSGFMPWATTPSVAEDDDGVPPSCFHPTGAVDAFRALVLALVTARRGVGRVSLRILAEIDAAAATYCSCLPARAWHTS